MRMIIQESGAEGTAEAAAEVDGDNQESAGEWALPEEEKDPGGQSEGAGADAPTRATVSRSGPGVSPATRTTLESEGSITNCEPGPTKRPLRSIPTAYRPGSTARFCRPSA